MANKVKITMMLLYSICLVILFIPIAQTVIQTTDHNIGRKCVYNNTNYNVWCEVRVTVVNTNFYFLCRYSRCRGMCTAENMESNEKSSQTARDS